METWVLVLFLTGKEAPAISTIPGYSSEQECSQSGGALHSLTGGRLSDDDQKSTFRLQWLCLPGPPQSSDSKR